jgi:transposase
VETGRRRRWSDAETLRIVEESDGGRRLVSATARRHGIGQTLLMSWQRARDEGRLGDEGPVTFTPLVMAAEPPQRGGCIEIALSNSRRLIVEPDVDATAVARLADALDPR